MNANLIYKSLLLQIINSGQNLVTRNSATLSSIDLPTAIFTETPLITLRKTAWKKAIREMEWFMSGNSLCPASLKDWWSGQLYKDTCYINGYATQFRFSKWSNTETINTFDQVKFILEALKNNPNSRRLILTSWNPGEMASITEVNDNHNTPTTCHNTCTQFFVREGALHLKTYQRSADMLLGVPHNWIQTWAMLLYFAYHSGLSIGTMQWNFGDAHIYKEDSHLDISNKILQANVPDFNADLVYKPEQIEYDFNEVPIFKASDFYINGEIPKPLVTGRPKLI